MSKCRRRGGRAAKAGLLGAGCAPDWSRFDTWAILGGRGLAAVDEARAPACRAWLAAEGYDTVSVDCSAGMATTRRGLATLLRWEERYGYALTGDGRSLDTLNDGFGFEVPVGAGLVLELWRPDVSWREDPRWMLGLLAIASDHCRYHLFRGCRFFCLLVIPEDSAMVNESIDTLRVPAAFRSPCPALHGFRR